MSIRIENVMINFPVLFTPKRFKEQGDFAYSCDFWFPRDHPAVKQIQDEIRAAATRKWAERAEEMLRAIKAQGKLCLRSGEELLKLPYPGAEKHAFLRTRANAQHNGPPLVVDADRTPLTEESGKIYSGARVNAVIEIWGQDNEFSKRINCTPRGVQFVADGVRLGGGSVARIEDFEPIPVAADSGGTGSADGLFD